MPLFLLVGFSVLFYFLFFSFPPFEFCSLDFDVRSTGRFFQKNIYISRVRLRVRFCFKSCLGDYPSGFFYFVWRKVQVRASSFYRLSTFFHHPSFHPQFHSARRYRSWRYFPFILSITNKPGTKETEERNKEKKKKKGKSWRKLAKAWAKLISNQALSNKAPSRVDSLALHCILEKDSNCFPSSSGGVDPLLCFPCCIFFTLSVESLWSEPFCTRCLSAALCSQRQDLRRYLPPYLWLSTSGLRLNNRTALSRHKGPAKQLINY